MVAQLTKLLNKHPQKITQTISSPLLPAFSAVLNSPTLQLKCILQAV